MREQGLACRHRAVHARPIRSFIRRRVLRHRFVCAGFVCAGFVCAGYFRGRDDCARDVSAIGRPDIDGWDGG